MGSEYRADGRVGAELTRLLAAERPWRLGRQIISVAEVTSTNDLARMLALGGAPEGTVVVADAQSSGRGRLGRAWHSPVGTGLWSSFVLRPPVPLTGLGPLALVVALGVRRAALACGAAACDIGIKWPNDVVARGRKLAGILTESAGGSAIAAPEFVVAGIGVNVRTPEGGFPGELRGLAIALEELLDSGAGVVEAAEFGAALVEHLSVVYSVFLARGFGALRDEWLAVNVTTGREVVVSGAGAGERPVSGLAESIDESGRLLLRLADGRTAAVAAGDVTLRRM